MSCTPTNDMISGIPRAIVHHQTIFVFVCVCVCTHVLSDKAWEVCWAGATTTYSYAVEEACEFFFALVPPLLELYGTFLQRAQASRSHVKIKASQQRKGLFVFLWGRGETAKENHHRDPIKLLNWSIAWCATGWWWICQQNTDAQMMWMLMDGCSLLWLCWIVCFWSAPPQIPDADWFFLDLCRSV